MESKNTSEIILRQCSICKLKRPATLDHRSSFHWLPSKNVWHSRCKQCDVLYHKKRRKNSEVRKKAAECSAKYRKTHPNIQRKKRKYSVLSKLKRERRKLKYLKNNKRLILVETEIRRLRRLDL